MNLKKRLVLLVIVFLPACAFAGTYSGGTGEPENPYLIATAEDLNDIGNHPEDFDKCFLMVNDINLADYTGTQFNVIGDESNPFTGLFDGNCYELFNLNYESAANVNYFGLFGFIEGDDAKVVNLGVNIADVNIPNGGDFGGVGVLVGRLAEGTVSQCYASDCRIRARELVGALVGSNYGIIELCYSRAEVLGGNDEGVGGLVGVNHGQIRKCFSTGSVSGVIDVGGLVGYNFPDGAIYDSYSHSDINATCCYAGGLVSGNKGVVQRCYSTGVVNVNGGPGSGLVSHGSATASFWDTETSDCNSSDGGTGLTTAEMQTESTFTSAGWDFIEIWDIGENQTYPFLRTHPAGDINHDDVVNFYDLAILADHWLEDAR